MKDTVPSYDSVKGFEGRKYTGMRVGGTHSWYYGQGEWEETKVSPDEWRFTYKVKKRRKWDAPEGSGAPTGTEYHWYILAHQNVRKLNANEYTTSMTGLKYKLAHRREGHVEWNASGRAQLRRLIAILEENAIELRHELAEKGGGLAGLQQESREAPSRRRENMVSRTVLQNGMALGILGQPSLEAYFTQTRTAGADAGGSPAVGLGPKSSSNSEFFPKNRR